ncbi:MAG: hypothetical protein Q7S76_03475 [bacterium]|nr:hypothetical protein [bacterium]
MNNDRQIVLISVFTFITVVMWITFELVKTTKTSTIDTTTKEILAPITSTIDLETFRAVQKRVTY